MIRRVIGTTLAGLCAVTGPLAGGAFAATADAALTLSASSVRPGVAFTVTPSAGCPSDSGAQTVELTFTDHDGTEHSIGSTETAGDGSWVNAVATLPVAGLDAEGNWLEQPVAAGAGTVGATCVSGDESGTDDDADDESGDDESGDDDSDEGLDASALSSQTFDDPDDDGDEEEADDGTDDGDDESAEDGDEDSDEDDGDTGEDGEETDDDESVTSQTYASIALTVIGSAPKLTLSATIVKPGASVTVTPGEGCSSTGVSEVQVALIELGSAEEDGSSGLPTESVSTTSTGTWSPVTLAVPSSTATGDYAVTATCSTGGAANTSYDAEPLALGTVRIGTAACGAHSVFTQLTGTYSGDIAGRGDVSLPSKLALSGAGPWTVKVRSASTGIQLAVRTLACAKPQYEIDVPKTGLSDSNKPRAKVCNTGRAPVAAILQVMKDNKFQKVDKETLDPGECVWLEGPKLDKGKQAKARVQIDAPGKGSDEVTKSFTVKRPRH
ncbi:MAG TPA: hypothetical protein VLL08_12490 [Kineosporiaceae bacterium]|nr:hypothetical protein [Kineosporiaceae bacterium]